MHLYDPNGSIHAERLRRERKENIQSLAFAFAVVLGLIAVVCFSFWVASLMGR